MLLRMSTATETPNRRRVPTDTLPLRLVMLRHEANISQRRAAFQCGITPRIWQGMEEGRSTANLLDVLQTVADEFGYDRDWLAYGGELDKKNPRKPDGDGGSTGPEPTAGKSSCLIRRAGSASSLRVVPLDIQDVEAA